MSYSKTYRTDDEVCYFHCIAHTVYRTEEDYRFALNDSDKDDLRELMKRLERLYADGVEVMQYTILDNHLHVILSENKQLHIKASEVKRRYEEFHQKNKIMDARSTFCHKFSQRLNNISCFMRDLQWYSATFFNNKRQINGHRKRGSLWNPRFRRCTLKGKLALLKCSLYVAMNPVRAGLVKRAEDYKWGSWGERKICRSHPHLTAWTKYTRKGQSEIAEDSFETMERDFAESLQNLEEAFAKHKDTNHLYNPEQVLILASNYFWDSGGLIRVHDSTHLAHDSPEKSKSSTS
jgi:REP element-mobilizing transposase RayT